MASIKSYNPFLLPKRQGSFKSREEFARKNIQQWIDDLPIGDVEKTAFDLYGKLDRLNRLEISPVNRFEVLELLQPSIEFVLDALKKGCAEGAIPLSIRRRMVADLRQDILIQAVKAYKTVLSQFHDATITGLLFHKHTRAEALKCVLLYLGETLLHSFMTYQPCLKYTWKELHGIYYYSVINELQTTDADTNKEKSDLPGIEDLYKQMLLLALANPNSMLCGEVERVNDILKEWASFVELVPIKQGTAAESFFLIDAKSDGMPCAPNLCKEENIAVGWYLITDRLDSMLEKKISTAEGPQANMRPTDAGALRLMKKLKDAWTQQIRPRELRNRTTGMVQLICGLDSLHKARGGETISRTMFEQPLAAASSSPGHHTIDSSLLDNDEVLIEVKPGVLELQRVYKTTPSQPEVKRNRVDGKECIATNKSEKGYCLNWPDCGDDGTRVGELVGVNPIGDDGKSSDLSFGVIRWMHAGQPGFLGMGVELLQGFIEPVILQRRQKNAKQVENIRGFLQRAEMDGSCSLIAPPFYVAKEDRYKVITGREEIPIDLTSIVDSTDSFVRFEFEQLSVSGWQ